MAASSYQYNSHFVPLAFASSPFRFLFLLFAFIICFSRINKENRIVFNSFVCHRAIQLTQCIWPRSRGRQRQREWGDSFGWKSNFVIHKSIRLRMVVLSRASWPYKYRIYRICCVLMDDADTAQMRWDMKSRWTLDIALIEHFVTSKMCDQIECQVWTDKWNWCSDDAFGWWMKRTHGRS